MTPPVPLGLSIRLCLIHGRVHCCPAVVGMRNGTGERPQPMTLATIPTKNVIKATYGTTIPKQDVQIKGPHTHPWDQDEQDNHCT